MEDHIDECINGAPLDVVYPFLGSVSNAGETAALVEHSLPAREGLFLDEYV